MVDITELLAGLPSDIVLQLAEIALWLQAIGILVLIWIIIQVINLFFNRKRSKMLKEIIERLDRLERKVTRKKSS